jgi:hypothetical protein
MRFNNRFCALMDIPDLPAGAFEHIGDNKIKPQGGGGFNPIAAITDPISSAIGTDGGGGGVLGALADIDPGPAIGSGLAEVDDFVNDEIPGGWATVGAVAVAAGTGYVDPSLFAAEAGAAGAGAAGGTAAGTGLTAGAGASGGLLASGGTVGALGGAGSAAGIAGTQAAAGLGIAGGSALAGTGAAIGAGLSGVGGLSPALPAAGGVGGAGAMSAQLAPGTILGTGLPGGGAIGSSYMLGAGGLPATNALGQLVPASSVSFGGQAVPSIGLSAKDALDAARLGKNLLEQSATTPAQATAQLRGTTVPRGGVDYSGLLNLLSPRMAQRRNLNSLLG